MQTDLSLYNYNATSKSGNDVTLHAIYNAGQKTSFGAFYGRDQISGGHQGFYGLEAGHQSGPVGVEGFAEYGSQSGVHGTILGILGRYAVTPGAGLGLSLQHASFSGSISGTRVGLIGDVKVADNVKLYGVVGNLSASGSGLSGSRSFVGLGAKFNFGPDGGVAFGKRGLLEFIPGL